jgi:hypothetical protein
MLMKTENDAILDDILSRWHEHCLGFRPGAQAASPMFRGALRARGEQTLQAITEDSHWAGVFKALDFHVGEMKEPWKSAIYCNAKNCYTGRTVWFSPRLPRDAIERAAIVAVARTQLIERLIQAGVM